MWEKHENFKFLVVTDTIKSEKSICIYGYEMDRFNILETLKCSYLLDTEL